MKYNIPEIRKRNIYCTFIHVKIALTPKVNKNKITFYGIKNRDNSNSK